jgi:ribonuclease G
MEKKSNRERVFNALKDALKKDRSKTNVVPMSELGLIEMTRKRTRETLNRMLCEPCFYCEGEGYLQSKRTICYNIYRDMRRESREIMGPYITLKVHPEIADLLLGEEQGIIAHLEGWCQKEIIIRPDPQLHLEQFEMYEMHKK